SAQIREILINESAWEEMTCLFAPSLGIVPPVGFLLTTAYSNYFVMSGSACRSNITVNRV
ncbi:curli production assembly/transport protein CsgE, partial [Escherichia coli]|nr:curli production assembly/transport protein CsgE [Escherichia coli]